jgi:hypothetical protein
MPGTTAACVFIRNARGAVRKHFRKCACAAGLAFIVCAVRHFWFPSVPSLQKKVLGELRKAQAGESRWSFGYNPGVYADDQVYECWDTRFPFGHAVYLYPGKQVKAVFPTFFGVFIGRGYLCGVDGKIIGVYETLFPVCVESGYFEHYQPRSPL